MEQAWLLPAAGIWRVAAFDLILSFSFFFFEIGPLLIFVVFAGAAMSDDDITVILDDGVEYVLKKAAWERMGTVQDLAEDCGSGDPVPVHAVSNATFREIVTYATKVSAAAVSDRKYDAAPLAAKFARGLAQSLAQGRDGDLPGTCLQDVGIAALYLGVSDLPEAIADCCADVLEGRSTTEIREILGIKDDWAEGAEDIIRADHSWRQEEKMRFK